MSARYGIIVGMAVAALCGGNRAHAQQEASTPQSVIPSISEEPTPFPGLSPQSVIQTSSSADTVYFCLPVDLEEKGDDQPISVAKRRRDLNVGEPRTARMIYFLPNDRSFRADVVQKMKDEIRNAQTFFREQMRAHGYGDGTFRLETDADGDTLVHRVDGQHPDSYYLSSTYHTVIGEVKEIFDLDVNVYVIVVDNSSGDRIGVNGRFAGGVGGRSGKNSGVVLVPHRFRSPVLHHELGHAFGLEHDFHNEAYIMSYGRVRDRLSACNAGFLAVHPYFSPDSPIEEEPPPSIEIISPQAYPAGSERVPVHLEVSDPEGLHQAILFATTLGPHYAAGFREVKACRGLMDVQNHVVEFDYDGTIPSIHGESLSNPPVHSMYARVVDTDGNVGEKSILLAETSPNHIVTLEEHTQEVTSVSFSPDGTILASGSRDHTIGLWDMLTEKNIAILKGHKGPVSSVSFSLDGTLLASAGRYTGGTIRLWRVPTERHTTIFGAHRGFSVGVVSFSPDGIILASGAGSTVGTIELWDVRTKTRIAILEPDTGSELISMSFSSDGTTLASASWDVINLWDVAAKQNIATLRTDTGGLFRAVSFSPDEKILASTEVRSDDAIRLWDVATKENIARLKGHKDWVTSVAFSPDGTILASGSIDGTIKLWDVAARENIVTLTGHAAPVQTVSFSSDGTILASGSNDRTVQLWDVFEWASVVPDAPVNLQAASGSEKVSLSWEAPLDDRGSEITGYAYRHKETGGSFSEWTDIPDSTLGSANAGSYTITGLTNGSTYTFELRAVNMHGGGRSASVTVTLPSGPTSTESEELPSEVALLGNYPNPFNPETTIGYALPHAGKVRLVVYDMLGQEVAVLVDGPQPAGRYTVRFHGDHLPSGPYAYRLQAGDEMVVRTMILAK